MSLTTKIILGLIVFHLLLGFGWILYKLTPGRGRESEPEGPGEEDPEID